MKKIFAAVLAAALLLAAPAAAQFSDATKAGQAPNAAAVGGPVGSPTYVMPPSSGGIINLSQPFADWLKPYIDALVNVLISALGLYLAKRYHDLTGHDMDAKQRDALISFAQRQASSLIADGMVKVKDGKIDVHSDALARAANQAQAFIPDAAKRFGLNPDEVASRIVDEIPRIAAGAQMLASSAAKALP